MDGKTYLEIELASNGVKLKLPTSKKQTQRPQPKQPQPQHTTNQPLVRTLHCSFFSSHHFTTEPCNVFVFNGGKSRCILVYCDVAVECAGYQVCYCIMKYLLDGVHAIYLEAVSSVLI